MVNFKEPYSYLYIFLFALAIRVVFVVLFPLQLWEYETIANNILAGQGFIFSHFGGVIYRSYCEPLYPFISAVVYFLTHHSVFALGLVQAVFSSTIAVSVYFLARSLYGQRIALLAGILIALHPGLIIYTTRQHPLTFDALFISLTLLAVVKIYNKISWRNIVIGGLVSGLCILTRPTILSFLPLALIYIFVRKKMAWGKSIMYAVVFFAVTGSIFLPWTLRNYFVQDMFMLTRSNGPYVFWLGNNPNFSGSAMDKDGRSLFKSAPKDFQKKIERLDEIGQNNEFLKDAFAYIKKYPWGFIERTAKKFYYFWWFNPQVGMLYPKSWLYLYKLFYIFVLSGALVGIFIAFKERLFKYKGEAVLMIFILLSISLLQSLFYIETRHRWAVEPILLIFTAKGVYSFFSKIYNNTKVSLRNL